MKTRYVELGRRFVVFSDAMDSDEAAWLSYYRPEYTAQRSFDWDSLIAPEVRCAVILGEAGSGKSWEFEARAEILNRAGATAIFLPLDDLVDRKIDDCLSREDGARFEEWRRRSERAVFFLDAVDDARLRDPQALRKSFVALENELGPAFGRVCFVLSCRVSDWQPVADLELLSRYFGNPDSSDETLSQSKDRQAGAFRVVQLAPLDRTQVALLAEAHGVEPVEAFLGDIDQAEARMFAGRPRDVEDLIVYWREHHKIGNLTDLLEHNLARKLRETKVRDDPLEGTKARAGAERLAAATVLARKSTVLLRDESSSTADIGHALDPADVLPDFDGPEQHALLARAVFDEATYGRVRFHHRTVREYLAARWLHRLLEEGCRPEIEDLLFRQKHGREFIAPSLLPVATWLAAFDSDLRGRLLAIEPLALIMYGDPESVDPMERASMLGILAACYAEQRPFWLDSSVLRRFAHQCFAPKIKALLSVPGYSIHAKYFLLLLIWHGRIADCAAESYRIANDPNEDLEIRSLAIRAVGAAADETVLGPLGASFLGLQEVSRRLAAALFDALYPRAFDVHQLIELIKLVRGGDGRPSDAPTYSLTEILKDAGRTPTRDLPALLTELSTLLAQPPLIGVLGTDSVSERCTWLLAPLKAVLIRAAQEVRELAESPELCRKFRQAAMMLIRCEEHGIGMVHDVVELERAINVAPNLKRTLFWDRVEEEARASTPGYVFARLPRLDSTDVDWLIQDALDPQLAFDKRRIAFEQAVLFWSWNLDEEEQQLDMLRAVVRDEASFAEYLESAQDYRARTRAERSREAAEREATRQRQKEENIDVLRGELATIRAGTNRRALSWLLSFASRDQGTPKLANVDFTKIETELTSDIAEAARDGAIVFWRTWRPPLLQEAPLNQTPGEVVIGLVGISWELQRGLKCADLNDVEAEFATRYALFEYNGFPDWLSNLGESHPQIVSQVLVAACTAEFEGSSGTLLQNLSYANVSLQRLLASEFEKLLRQREPENLQSLRYVLLILAATERGNSIAEIAKARVPSLTGDRPRRAVWLSFWFQAYPSAALDFIEGLGFEEEQSAVAEVASTVGAHGLLPKRSTGPTICLEPGVLKRLIALVFRRVVPSTSAADFDPVEGGVVGGHPDSRFFRESILQQLASMPGDEPYRILMELADTKGLENERLRFLQSAERQAANECEPTFRPDEVYRWEHSCIEAPKTSDDLFRIALRRLRVLQRDVEYGDFSDRGLFHPKVDEKVLQKYIANRLKNAARGQYSVHREEEVDLENRTDIRLWHTKDLLTTIEVKCANKWTYRQLSDALQGQLVGKYLRDQGSRHGVLLLGHMGGQNFWKAPNGKRLSFAQLTSALNEEAAQIASTDSEVASLATFGIDFRVETIAINSSGSATSRSSVRRGRTKKRHG
jgi:hypothetical protein